MKKARKAGLALAPGDGAKLPASGRAGVARRLFELAAYAQGKGWSAEELLRDETRRRESRLRQKERARSKSKVDSKLKGES